MNVSSHSLNSQFALLFISICHLTEIDIPADIDIPQDDADVDAGEAEAARKEEQKWTDLDLDVFRT
jgi:hypothetical protein